MELLNTLRESQRMRSGGRRVLRKYGISNEAEITQPFAEMDPGKATRLILNWLTLNAKNGYDIELRIMVPEERMVYRSRIRMRGGAMFVQQTRGAPELVGKALHQWNDHVNYRTLTLEEIISVQRAELTNSLQEDCSILQELYGHHRDKAKRPVPIIKAEGVNDVAAPEKP